MHVLVTGGAGYVGSYMAKLLARAGVEPTVFDNLSMGHRHAVRWGPLIEGDLSDSALVTSVLAEHEIDAVVHFTTNAYVGESMPNPRKYFHNNVARLATSTRVEADLDGEIGEEDDPETHLIPLVIGAALGNRACAEVFGTDYDTPDGTAVQDYIHVMDLATAHQLGFDYLLGGGASTAVNLGTGNGHSVRDIIGAVA